MSTIRVDTGRRNTVTRATTLGVQGPGGNSAAATSTIQGGIKLRRDWGGTADDPINVGIQGRDVDDTAPNDGEAYVWDAGAQKFVPREVGNEGSGDISTAIDEVVGIRGRAVSSATPPTSGQLSVMQDGTVAYLPAYVNVKAFGAVGDDSTDDIDAFEAALDALPAAPTRGVLYVPPGTYRLSRPLQVLRSYVTICGEGTLKLITSVGAPVAGPCVLMQYQLEPAFSVSVYGGNRLDFTGAIADDANLYIPLDDCDGARFDGWSELGIKSGHTFDALTVGNFYNLYSSSGRVKHSVTTDAAVQVDLWPDGAGTAHQFVVTLQTSGGTTVLGTGNGSVTPGNDYAFEMSLKASVLYLFIDGALMASTPCGGTIVQKEHETFLLGAHSIQFPETGFSNLPHPEGGIHYLQITDTGEHTGAYSAPTTKPTVDANTHLLLTFDDDVDRSIVWAQTRIDGTIRDAALPVSSQNLPGLILENRIEGLELVSNRGTALRATLTINSKFLHLRGTARHGAFFGNNCFTNTVFDISIMHTGSFIGDQSRDRFGIAFAGSANGTTLDRFDITGFAYPLCCVFGSGSISNGYATPAKARVGVYFGENNNGGVWKLSQVDVSDESAALVMGGFVETSYLLDGIDGFHGSNMIAENQQLGGIAMTIDGGSGIRIVGGAFQTNAGTGTERVAFETAADDAVVIENVKTTIGPAIPWTLHATAPLNIEPRHTEGRATIAMGAANYTLTREEWLDRELEFTGTVGAPRDVISPAIDGVRRDVYNNTTDALTFKAAGGTGPTVAVGKRATIGCDGTNNYRLTADV